jgi:hypothetical protein
VTATSELTAIRCKSCGGTVRYAAGKRGPACLFCGADASELVPVPPPEGIEPPVGAVPFAVDAASARAAFVKFAGGSIWYPSDLRRAKLELHPLMLPAWAWSGEVETHWTGLVSAGTRSGKRPTAGAESVRFEQILVPASRTLRLSELARLGRYDESALVGVDAARAAETEAAVELSELTRSAARERAHTEMLRRHEATIRSAHDLLQIHASSIASGLDGHPVLVPVWIGAYRYGRRSYRVLVNGQTGLLVGEAPLSWWKILAAIVLVVTLVLSVVIAVVTCLGGGSALIGIAGAIAGSR